MKPSALNPRRLARVLAAGLLLAVAAAPLSADPALAANKPPAATTDKARVVTVGGGVTEIAYALGAGAQVVGVDTSSLYPKAATKLPQVGYQRMLSAEGVLALRPTLALVSEDAGPPAAIAQLKTAGVKLVSVTNDHSLTAARERITTVATALGREAEGKRLIATLDREAQAALAKAKAMTARPKVLFIFAHGQNAVNVGGKGTAADEMIRLAGGTNALSEFGGYKPLTAEAVVKAAPDVILITAIGASSLGGVDAILQLPGVSLTPAGKNRRVVAMDDVELLTFGPRTGRAIAQLNAGLIGGMAK
ncbi:Hemin-binding periplasmic protein HmuT precursor [compost metagenome]